MFRRLNYKLTFWGVLFLTGLFMTQTYADSIPLPEHPRPDFERADWINLNGPWKFQFDGANAGLTQKWFEAAYTFDQTIIVPFPWGSKLSQVENKADIAWYARTINVPETWKGKRVFFVVSACDWKTTVWLDGKELGTYQGGYTPFEFELTSLVRYGQPQQLVLRVDDTPLPFKLFGKQGYGEAKGIWQTPYLEARGVSPISYVHFSPDIDAEKVVARVRLLEPAPENMKLQFNFETGDVPDSPISQPMEKGSWNGEFTFAIPNAHLWTLDDPYLYNVTVTAGVEGQPQDSVKTYFGMRKIGVTKLPGTDFSYVALNNKPIYLQLTLDQAYHPDGFYTFPSDDFVRDEILRSKRIGLNGMRVHVKTPLTRKLYWADRLGMLIMEDIPNSWGEPDADMRQEIETCLRGLFQRDFNHPSVFSHVIFNETWGLFTKEDNKRIYKPETQRWVADMVQLAKALDPTRLVEDNSACNEDHVVTDVNSWHVYLPGYRWNAFLDDVVKNTHPGSDWNFAKGYQQGDQPMFNSECGNVWGYEGSTGDVDWSWDYHCMMDSFRRHPKIGGWLYTEHHDVINEWNGYCRFDRSPKFTGLEELVPGMTLKDWHSPFYVAVGKELCQSVKPDEDVQVPLFASFMTDADLGPLLKLHWTLSGWNDLGVHQEYACGIQVISYRPWMNQELPPLSMHMPSLSSVVLLSVELQSLSGDVLQRNFTTFVVDAGKSPRDQELQNEVAARILRIDPAKFSDAKWSLKQWNVLDGLKVDGAGSGYFEYTIPWPENLDIEKIGEASFKAELSAKQLFGKDQKDSSQKGGDFMRGKGTHDPSSNPNSYPMTDATTFPSEVRISVNGQSLGIFDLPDDPADHRGILSWFSQPQDKKLREAGSYGYLVSATIPNASLRKAAIEKEIVIRLEVGDGLPGGLAIYGERFGRYPLDPSVIFVMK